MFPQLRQLPLLTKLLKFPPPLYPFSFSSLPSISLFSALIFYSPLNFSSSSNHTLNSSVTNWHKNQSAKFKLRSYSWATCTLFSRRTSTLGSGKPSPLVWSQCCLHHLCRLPFHLNQLAFQFSHNSILKFRKILFTQQINSRVWRLWCKAHPFPLQILHVHQSHLGHPGHLSSAEVSPARHWSQRHLMDIVIELRFRNFSHLVSGCASSAQQRLHWGARYSGRMRSSSPSLPAILYIEETLKASSSTNSPFPWSQTRRKSVWEHPRRHRPWDFCW